jgi:hypothetical protein
LLYTFDCYTQTGINATVRLNNHWTAQVGVSPGCDVAPWQTRDAKPTLNACACAGAGRSSRQCRKTYGVKVPFRQLLVSDG